MGTPPLLQGACPRSAIVLAATAAGEVWGSGAAAVTRRVWCHAAEWVSRSDGSAAQQHSPGRAGGDSHPRFPTTQPPASAARSGGLTKWKYFSVSKSFTVKKRETQQLSRRTQTEMRLCRCPPHQEAFHFPKNHSTELVFPPQVTSAF